ncbi:alpha/beta hydrolase family esterase [Pseudobdellovibrio exovorus]|uniref:PHB depolymerase family esterase n=1 Tax=Pseudobdellovibrio exovorus JSS TaxID=1184267 RepID=M4V981_9BACT|nr:PHB depolymerase family esterase [Pseudobdellovibrio exovorus]AGH94985.1 hypothetical protein A11Q_767 [Pseudobdellovibrio exovorus JSS]
MLKKIGPFVFKFLLCFLVGGAAKAQLYKEAFYLSGRKFTVLNPTMSAADTARPVVLLLHGCQMTAEQMIQMTGIEQWAQQKDFIVLAPEQSQLLNPMNCWNWFLPANQQPVFPSEIATLAQAVRHVVSRYNGDPRHVYAMGFSSGAYLTANLFYCYPDLLAGVTIHSGGAFKAAESGLWAAETMKKGSFKSDRHLSNDAYMCARPRQTSVLSKKMIVVQGSKDDVVDQKNALQLSSQFLGFLDFADDQKWNQSLSFQKNITTAGNKKFPVQITQYVNDRVYLHSIHIENLPHHWSGGQAGSTYAEPHSLDVTEYSLKVFLDNR